MKASIGRWVYTSILLFVDVIPEFRLLPPVMLMDGQITLAHFKQSPSAHTLLLLNPVNSQKNTTNLFFSQGQLTIRGMSSVSPLSRRGGVLYTYN